MSIYHYVKTTQPSTAIRHAVRGNFLSPDEISLILSKESRIEIYRVDNDCLSFVVDYNLYCDIDVIEVCQLQTRMQSSLFILTKRQEYRVISFDAATQSVVTDLSGTLEEKNARVTDTGVHYAIDAKCQVVYVSVFKGFIHVIPLVDKKASIKGKGKATLPQGVVATKPFSIRIPEFTVQSMIVLKDRARSAMALLCVDETKERYLKTYEFNLRDMSLLDAAKQFKVRVNADDHKLIPVPSPFDGVIVVGEMMISYYDLKGASKSVAMDSTVVLSYAMDTFNNAILLGNSSGQLHMLRLLSTNRSTVSELILEKLDEVPAPSCLAVIGRDLVFIGSARGDSSLIQMQIKSSGSHSITTLYELPNLGPITDFCVFDLDKQGRQTVVCCSGVDNDGTLRVVQNGLGFIPQGGLPLQDMKALWPLRVAGSSKYDDTIVVSTTTSTRYFHIPKDSQEMQEWSTYGHFVFNEPTLAIARITADLLVQVTSSSVRLMTDSGQLVCDWTPPASAPTIVIADLSGPLCGLSCGADTFVLLKIENHAIVEKGKTHFGREIACLHLGHIDIGGEQKQVAAIGLWQSQEMHIVSLQDLSVISSLDLPTDAPPHSILLLKMEGIQYLFITIIDGHMLYYSLADNGAWQGRKETTLSTHAVTLHPFRKDNETAIFASSNHPTVITSVRRHIMYSAVNAQNVCCFGMFNSKLYPECMILGSPDLLLLGRMDPVRKLQFSKVPLNGEMGKRLVYHDTSKTIAVGTSRVETTSGNIDEHYTGRIRIFDARTMQCLQTHTLQDQEVVESITVAFLKSLNKEFIFVGTAILNSEEATQLEGRVLMLQVLSNREYKLVDAVKVPGVVHCIKPFMGSVAMTVNGVVYYLDDVQLEQPEGQRLYITPKTKSKVLQLSMDTKGEYALVGDLMQSVSLYKMEDPATSTIALVGTDYYPSWITCVKILQDDTYLAAEMFKNIFTLRRKIPTDPDEKISQLQITGQFHIGDQINCFESVVQQNPEDPDTSKQATIYGTVSGAIGIVGSLSQDMFELLQELQMNILMVKKNIGDFDYHQWRTFDDGMRVNAAHNIIDGDVIESFMDMPTDEQMQVITGANGGTALRYSRTELENILGNFLNELYFV